MTLTLPLFSSAVPSFDRYDKYKHRDDVCKESQVNQDIDGSSVLKAEEDVSETSSAATTERSAFDLEQFQQHLYMYTTKWFEYTYPVYRARWFLAAIDYHMHLNRQTMHNQQNQLLEGQRSASRLFPYIYCRIYHRESGR
ncbi:uncharacterized protein J5F26_017101 isoform 2-T2 [Ciconia maguari]